MRINAIAPTRSWGVKNKTKNNAFTTFKEVTKDSVSFTSKTNAKPEKGTLEWALAWDEDARKKELQDEYEKAKKGMSWWKRAFTMALENLEKANEETLNREKIMASTLTKNSASIQTQISEQRKLSEKNKIIMAQIEEDKKRLAKWGQASELASAFKIHNEGNLDDRIAGYEAEKKIIRNLYVEPVAMEKAGMEANIPNAIMLYGPIGTGKTTFVRAVANETGAKLIEIDPTPDDFAKEVRDELNNAKERYKNEKRRTIIVLNEAEDPLEDTKLNKKNIRAMKTWLDNCALLPDDDISNASATTFFFTTNHPLDISDEILLREEKIAKSINLEPAAEDNIRAIIEFYIKQYDKDGSILSGQEIDYDKIIKMLNPDKEKGAYGNDKIKKMVENAFADFNSDIDNEKTFEEYLVGRIERAKRNILPTRLQEYQEQIENLCEDENHENK